MIGRKFVTTVASVALMLAGVPAAHAAAAEREGAPSDSIQLPRSLELRVPAPLQGEYYSHSDLEAIYPGAAEILEVDNFIEGLTELERSGIHKVPASGGSMAGFTYVLPEGQLTLPSAAAMEAARSAGVTVGTVAKSSGATADGLVEPAVSVRTNGIAVAIGFNRTEQQMLASGAAAVLALAICAVPGVGWLACGIASVAVAVGTTYVTRNGICSNNRTLWWYDVPGGSTIQCRSTAPVPRRR